MKELWECGNDTYYIEDNKLKCSQCNKIKIHSVRLVLKINPERFDKE